MDYKAIYLKYYNIVIEQTTQEAKKEYQQAKKNNRPFLYIHNPFMKNIHDRYINDNELKLRKKIPEVFNIFTKRADFAESDPISSVFSNEILKIYQTKYNNTISYNSLIEKLATYEALGEISRNLSNYAYYLKFVYKTEMWDYFKLKKIENGYENSEEYKAMKKKLYPIKNIPTEEVNILKPKSKKSETTYTSNPPVKTKTSEEFTIEAKIKKITEDEKKFIIHVIHELTKGEASILTEQKVVLVELLKLLVITKDVCNTNLFVKKAGSNNYYNHISIGINNITPLEQAKFISDLQSKLDDLGIPVFAKLILEYSTTKKRKINKTKKN